jgi:hypothetical protein
VFVFVEGDGGIYGGRGRLRRFKGMEAGGGTDESGSDRGVSHKRKLVTSE